MRILAFPNSNRQKSLCQYFEKIDGKSYGENGFFLIASDSQLIDLAIKQVIPLELVERRKAEYREWHFIEMLIERFHLNRITMSIKKPLHFCTAVLMRMFCVIKMIRFEWRVFI